MRKIIRKLAWDDGTALLLARVLQLAIAFLLTVTLVREFGLESAGTYTIAALAQGITTLACTLGLGYSLARGHRSPGQAATILVALTGAATPVALIVLAIYGTLMGGSAEEAAAIIAFAAAGVAMAQLNVMNTLLVMRGSVRLTLVPPVVSLVGLFVGWWHAETVLGFAVWTTLSRIAGNVIVLATFRYERVPVAVLIGELRQGARHLPTDLIGLASDQVPAFLLALLLPRAELGIYGICRQILTAAETPAWAFVQAKYPALVSRQSVAEGMGRQLIGMSLAVAASCTVGSFVLGWYVYEIQHLGLLVAALMVVLPARYLQHLYEQLLRAGGRIDLCTILASVKFALACTVLPLSVAAAGLWGAIGAVSALSVVLLVIYAIPRHPMLSENVLSVAGEGIVTGTGPVRRSPEFQMGLTPQRPQHPNRS